MDVNVDPDPDVDLDANVDADVVAVVLLDAAAGGRAGLAEDEACSDFNDSTCIEHRRNSSG